MMRRLAAAVACLLAATPASAVAAPGWSTAPVSGPGALAPTGLELDAAGNGALTWESFAAGRKRTGLALRSPAGTWTLAPDLPAVTWGLARVHPISGRTQMVGMRAYAFGAYNRARWEVVKATGGLDGSFGPVRVVVRDVRWVGSVAGARGEVLTGWVTRVDDRLRLAGRRAPLSPAGIARPLLALGPGGHALAAWTRGRRIEARLRTPAGHWGPVREIAFTGPVPDTLDGAVSAEGAAIVAWGSSEFRGEDRQPRLRFRAATSGRSGWTTHRLQAYIGDAPVPPRVVAAFDPAGHGLVAWADIASVRLARLDGSRPESLLVGRAVSVDDLAASRNGEAAVVFTPPTPAQGPGPGPFVTTGAPGDGLDPAVDIGAPGTAPIVGAKLAYDPLTARPTVAWTAIQDGVTRLWTAAKESA